MSAATPWQYSAMGSGELRIGAGQIADAPVRRWRTDVWLIVACVIAAITRLYVGQHIWIEYDGWWHLFIARQEDWATFVRDYRSATHPPLYLLALRLSLELGSSRLVYRAVSILFGIATVFLIGKIARRLTRDSRVASTAALIFALSPAAILISCEVRSYSLAVFLILAAFWHFLEAIDPRQRRRTTHVLCFSVLASLGLLAHYSAVFFLMASVLAAALAMANDAELRRALLPTSARRVCAGALALVPLPIAILFIYGDHASHYVGRLSHLPQFYWDSSSEGLSAFLSRTLRLETELFLPPLAEALPTAAIVALALSAMIVLALPLLRPTSRRVLTARAMPFVFLLLVGAGFLVGALRGIYPFGGYLRHQFLLFPFLLLAAAVALDEAVVRLRSARAKAALLAVAIAVAVANGWWQARELWLTPKEAYAPEIDAYRNAFPEAQAVYVDQFSGIGFFAHHPAARWRFAGTCATNLDVDVYLVGGGGRLTEVLWDRGQWIVDPSDPRFLTTLSHCLESRGLSSVVLFSLREQASIAPSKTALGALAHRVEGRASRQSLELGSLTLWPGFLLAEFRVPGREWDRPRLRDRTPLPSASEPG